ncbi:ADP-heptose:LPS heptosyltransferase [Arthrobacter sp. ov407]|uniref:glycosyltransferase family 9 protein n=1 Tax=Arthrobacter sp. ov407 TaxID=1761748 RepID=UPI000881866B|nr:glycosyltransferase family 9 protein [Arthrobacter sp. ov407]SDL83192.1 ADP-heptose:LPS heptosyltransferase [Arthrobacter sp. ov407]
MAEFGPGESGNADVVGWGVGPVLEKFDRVRRIAVLRGGGLGDLLFALPAVAALRAAYPDASITVLGTPVHQELVGSTAGPGYDVRILPFAEGVRPGREVPEALEAFFAQMRQARLDLAVQLHGGGRFSNPFLLRLDARHSVGARTPDAARLERNLPYAYYQHEPLRALEVAGLAGAPPVGLEARLRPLGRYTAGLGPLLRGESSVVVIHPGATDPRRRWPAQNFGEVAAACAADGSRVLVVGTRDDEDLATAVVEAASSARVTSLAGELALGGLAALLAAASVLVGNDSGPRHLAQALGTPTVGLYWAGNVINAGPLGRSRHRVHVSWLTHCPECGADVTQVGWTAPRCPHESTLVAGISVEAVYQDARMFTARSPLPRGR